MEFLKILLANWVLVFPENRIPTHLGEVLLEEFLKPLEISKVFFAKHEVVPLQRINEIVRGKRGVTLDTAWRFAQAFGTTPELWMNLHTVHDLAISWPTTKVERMRQLTDKAI